MRYVDNTTPGVAANFFGAGLGGFQDGDPASGIRGTEFTANYENDILGNLMRLLTRGGVAPTPGRYDDVADAIAALVAAASGFAPGDFKCTSRTTADPGWVMASGRTIGSAASGATERANDDTLALFKHNWETFPDNIRLPIQTSAGAASARGVSAEADFAANKRLPLLDASDYVFIGRGNMSGTPAGRITAALNGLDTTVLGAVGGAEGHALTIAELAAHTHTSIVTGGATAGSTGGPVNSNTAGITGSTGLGDAHPNVQPGLVVNVFVKL